MMKKLLSAVFVMVALSACNSTPPPINTQTAPYDAKNQARIRLYGQNQVPTVMWHSIDCVSNTKGTKENVGGGFADALGSFVGRAKSDSLGIAETEASKDIASKNGILSKAFFREFVVDANKPLNVQSFFLGLTTISRTPQYVFTQKEGSCEGTVVSFIPQAGHDYEVISVKKEGCNAAIYVAIYEVSKSGNVKPIPMNPAYSCKR